MQQEFIYYQPKWKGRKKVKHFVAALSIGATVLSLHYVYNKVDKPTEKGWTRETVFRSHSEHRPPEILCVTVFLLNGTTTWLVPDNFASLVSVQCIAAGSSGDSTNSIANSGSGGGGAYAKITTTSTTLTPGVTSINVGIGAGGAAVTGNSVSSAGGATWWNATSLANAVTNGSAVSCAAAGAGAAAGGGSGGAGGTAANSVGTTKFSGGNGHGSASNQGGGGAAGPAGAGTNGSATAGGAANLSTTAGPTTAANGNSGTEFDASHGCGTGAYTVSNTVARTGGLYGGGGTTTSAAVASGPGANGLLVITFTVKASFTNFSKPIRFSTRRF